MSSPATQQVSGGDPARSPDVAVLGGGFMGLGVADRLARGGCRVTLYEAAARAGGVSAAMELGGVTVDRFYHTILPGDTELLNLTARLGMGNQVAWRAAPTGFYRDGRHYGISNLVEFLRFPVLTPLERLRLGWTLFHAQHGLDWPDVRHLTCEQWLLRTCGEGVVKKLWRPLLRAKLGEAAPRVSASFIWATMNRLQDAKRGAGVSRRDRFGFLRGSYGPLLDTWVAELTRRAVTVRTSAAVAALRPLSPSGNEPSRGGWELATAAGVFRHDHVVATIPPAVLARTLGDLPGMPRERLTAVEYLGVVVEVLLLSRPLGPYYLLNLSADDLPLTGVIETTNLAPPGYFHTRSLVYLPRYLAPDDPWHGRPEEEITPLFHEALRRVYPAFSREMIVARSLQRAPFVQPIHTTDYADRLPPVRLADGLWLASTAQIHPWPLNNDRVLRQARQVSEALLAETSRAPAVEVPS